MAHEILTAQRLRELLHYDCMTGVFTWRVDRSWNAKAGSTAGSLNKVLGYIILSVDKRRYWAHRLAWLYHYGEWPIGLVDHEDRAGDHNWIGNLRDSTKSQNNQNRTEAGSHSASGILGVHWDKSREKWTARLQLNGKLAHSSRHDSIEEARAAYLSAKARLHPFAPTEIAS